MKLKDLIQELVKLNLQGYGESEVFLDSASFSQTKITDIFIDLDNVIIT